MVIGKMDETISMGTGYGMTSSGKMGVITTTDVSPGKTEYKCNDGITYWRSE